MEEDNMNTLRTMTYEVTGGDRADHAEPAGAEQRVRVWHAVRAGHVGVAGHRVRRRQVAAARFARGRGYWFMA